MSPERRSLLALQVVFALNGMGLAMWLPRIPDVKEALGLDLLTLSFCLFAMPFGTMLGFLAVDRVIQRFGARATVRWAAPIFLIAFIGPSLAGSAPSLALALFVSGCLVAITEVGKSVKASEMERLTGRRLMTQCHAFWSFGSVAGALIGGLFGQAGISFLAQQASVLPILAAATVFAAARLNPDAVRERAEPGGGFELPSRALILLCLVPVGALLTEGAMMEWSALLLRQELRVGPLAAAATFAAFATSMALARLMGDRLAEHFGPQRVLGLSGLVMGAGMLAFALSPGIWLSAPAAALTGFGAGNIYPLSLSLAGQMPGRTERNVATVALVSFTAFLVGPPAIGVVANTFGLPAALAMLAPLGIAPVAILTVHRTAPRERQPQ